MAGRGALGLLSFLLIRVLVGVGVAGLGLGLLALGGLLLLILLVGVLLVLLLLLGLVVAGEGHNIIIVTVLLILFRIVIEVISVWLRLGIVGLCDTIVARVRVGRLCGGRLLIILVRLLFLFLLLLTALHLVSHRHQLPHIDAAAEVHLNLLKANPSSPFRRQCVHGAVKKGLLLAVLNIDERLNADGAVLLVLLGDELFLNVSRRALAEEGGERVLLCDRFKVWVRLDANLHIIAAPGGARATALLPLAGQRRAAADIAVAQLLDTAGNGRGVNVWQRSLVVLAWR